MDTGTKSAESNRFLDKRAFLYYYDRITKANAEFANEDWLRAVNATLDDALHDDELSIQSFIALCVHVYAP